jgi:hypothetical protein
VEHGVTTPPPPPERPEDDTWGGEGLTPVPSA